MTVIELVASLVAILGAAIVFTNAVEMLGDRLDLGQGAAGSVLAAVGTALPETMIPTVAIIVAALTGGSAAAQIGVGAILGAPFLLTTLAMFVVGASVIGFRDRRESGTRIDIHEDTTRRDVSYFLIFFSLAAVAGIWTLPIYLKVPLAILLVGAYAFYVRQTLKHGGGEQEAPEKLWLWPFSSEPPTWAVAAQLIAMIGVMVVGAHFFVEAVEHISKSLGVPPGLIALVLAPLATELPEKFNSVYWARDNDDKLAFGNITGAMVFQSMVPVALGISLTPWDFDFLNWIAVALALFSGALLYLQLKRKKPVRASLLLVGGALYAVFVVVATFTIL
ncbi:MAG: sodium:calcium antiporter [Actinomycetota bacterium]|nr:sodium:calcium antiporter [Actinomycetota bacterium]